MGMGIITLQFKIFVMETENVLHLGIDVHPGQGARLARQLQLDLLDVVQINMHITKGMHKFPRLQTTHLRHHHGQQGIRGNVERHAQKRIRTPLVELAGQFPIDHIELE